MDPTHIIASRAFDQRPNERPTPQDVQSFYDTAGSDWFLVLAKLRARIAALQQQRSGDRKNFALALERS